MDGRLGWAFASSSPSAPTPEFLMLAGGLLLAAVWVFLLP